MRRAPSILSSNGGLTVDLRAPVVVAGGGDVPRAEHVSSRCRIRPALLVSHHGRGVGRRWGIGELHPPHLHAVDVV